MPSSKQDMSSEQEAEHIGRELSSELSESPAAGRELSSELIEAPAGDRELSSELAEPPIDPAFLRMLPPSKHREDFNLQVNEEALWRWQLSVEGIFKALQKNLSGIGHSLSASSCARVKTVIKRHVDYFAQKVQKKSDSNVRRALRSGHWSDVVLHPEKICQKPSDIISELRKDKKRMESEIEEAQSQLKG